MTSSGAEGARVERWRAVELPKGPPPMIIIGSMRSEGLLVLGEMEDWGDRRLAGASARPSKWQRMIAIR